MPCHCRFHRQIVDRKETASVEEMSEAVQEFYTVSIACRCYICLDFFSFLKTLQTFFLEFLKNIESF